MCSPSLTPLGASAPPVHVLQVMEYSAVPGQNVPLLLETLVCCGALVGRIVQRYINKNYRSNVVKGWVLLMPGLSTQDIALSSFLVPCPPALFLGGENLLVCCMVVGLIQI